MSKTPTIVFDGVWKRFRRGAVHDSLRDLVPAMIRRASGRTRPETDSKKDFWALQDLSFEVKPGEVLGIIGPNGAGKSTTLKILNGIMEPTKGHVHAVGAIAALIEVSAGFHPDLTGRQNVFLQGAIMGMRKSEVVRKFDAIVEFSGISEFIDSPVKRYSSGMNARLGFSIAAHLDPEILIIDEVLAVGDRAFQQRAFGRIKEMAAAGAPVVLVSHQLDRIAELCTKAIVLERGTVKYQGTPIDCINQYVIGQSVGVKSALSADHPIQFASIVGADGLAGFSGDVMSFVAEGESSLEKVSPYWTPAFRVYGESGAEVLHAVIGADRGIAPPTAGKFRYEVSMQMNLAPGVYGLDCCLWDIQKSTDVVTGPRLQFEVMEKRKFYGPVQLNSEWKETP